MKIIWRGYVGDRKRKFKKKEMDMKQRLYEIDGRTVEKRYREIERREK